MIQNYRKNMMKNSLYIFGTRCDAITTLQNLKFRFHLSVEKQKKTNCIRGKLNQMT